MELIAFPYVSYLKTAGGGMIGVGRWLWDILTYVCLYPILSMEGIPMVRTTIYLPEELHSGLKHLAVEMRCPMADLLRKAVEETYHQELADLRAAQKAWKSHLKRPEKAVSARGYFTRRAKDASGGSSTPSTTASAS